MAKAAPSRKRKAVNRPEKEEVLADYKLAYMSRQASLIGRKEVLTGKAKFGIFGDGKEVAQIAMAKAFQKGDWRAGYYRDQTLMMALGVISVRQFFAQLYADTNLEHDPCSGGRQMNSHFSTRFLASDGTWLDQLSLFNSSADISPTAGQMARLVGLGYASKLYQEMGDSVEAGSFSQGGSEVAFGTIGNASTAEGVFWESLNAAVVLQLPVAFCIWDDGYGISVPNKYQIAKESISDIVEGFRTAKGVPGLDSHVVDGWNYPALVEAFTKGIGRVRDSHAPALFHITDLTQPQGHSTSGSHERYKSEERLQFEKEFDCLTKMRAWIIDGGMATAEELDELEKTSAEEVEAERRAAAEEVTSPIESERDQLLEIYEKLKPEVSDGAILDQATTELKKTPKLMRRSVMSSARSTLVALRHETTPKKKALVEFIDRYESENEERYDKWTWVEGPRSPLNVKPHAPEYPEQPEAVPGSEILRDYFDMLFERDPRVFAVGEDIGQLGGVNQGFRGLQEKYGEHRVTDTGIREATILGQGIGAAMRGLRPIVDIQYLDYVLYCFQTLSDDLATVHYRSAGGQAAPVVIRTRGHRLEGIWHTGSPLGTLINGVRGVHVCVPRNMVQAAGLYNTLFQGDDPGLLIEVLNGYRVKENRPSNLGDYSVPLGVPEVLRPGRDVTVVTYGACVKIADDACKALEEMGIDVELIDVQTLLPFDRNHVIGASVEKTGAALFLDEDVPGGASAFMMEQVLEGQQAYECLDAPPETLTAKPHRSAYASDGDYWSKPNREDVIESVYGIMRDREPARFPALR